MAGRAKMNKSIKRLVDERDRLLIQMTALKNQIAGIETAISLLQRDDDQVDDLSDGAKAGRGTAKMLLLDLLREVGTIGLNAADAERLAKQRGQLLKRGTAASNLSRLKSDGVVAYDGEKYRLREFSFSRQIAEFVDIPLRVAS